MTLDFDPNVDYYKALGVEPKATNDEIKKVYRKLAKQYHPDSTGGDKSKEARFKEISAAYDVLGDATKRAQYDEIRAMGGGRPGGRVRRGPGGPGAGAGGFGAGPQVWDLGDLFSQMFQGQAGGGGTRRAVRFEQGDDDAGWVFESRSGGPPPGYGAQEAVMESKTRASDGSWLTVKGSDVYSDVRIPFAHAILGTLVEVPTMDGVASVKIPPGSSSGRKLRLRGKGAAGPGGPGDHYVTVQIDVPSQLDDEGKKLLHALTSHLQRDKPRSSR